MLFVPTGACKRSRRDQVMTQHNTAPQHKSKFGVLFGPARAGIIWCPVRARGGRAPLSLWQNLVSCSGPRGARPLCPFGQNLVSCSGGAPPLSFWAEFGVLFGGRAPFVLLGRIWCPVRARGGARPLCPFGQNLVSCSGGAPPLSLWAEFGVLFGPAGGAPPLSLWLLGSWALGLLGGALRPPA